MLRLFLPACEREWLSLLLLPRPLRELLLVESICAATVEDALAFYRWLSKAIMADQWFEV
jgi:hypothetical protein